MKKLSIETWTAIASAVFAAVAVILSALSWNTANLADDNMIEHEIFSRQVNHCLDQFDAASSYFSSYVTYLRLAQEAKSSEKSGDIDGELTMLNASNQTAESLLNWYSSFSGSVLRDSMLMPEKLAEAEKHLDDTIKTMQEFYLEQDLEGMALQIDNGRFPLAIRIYRDQCRSYFANKKLVLPDGR